MLGIDPDQVLSTLKTLPDREPAFEPGSGLLTGRRSRLCRDCFSWG